MLQVTDPQLENLMYLRDVVIPRVLEMPIVNLNDDPMELHRGDGLQLGNYAVKNACGTVGCLLGHYAMMRHGHTEEAMFRGNVDHEQLVRDDFGKDACDRGIFQGHRRDYETPYDDVRARAETIDKIITEKATVL